MLKLLNVLALVPPRQTQFVCKEVQILYLDFERVISKSKKSSKLDKINDYWARLRSSKKIVQRAFRHFAAAF